MNYLLSEYLKSIFLQNCSVLEFAAKVRVFGGLIVMERGLFSASVVFLSAERVKREQKGQFRGMGSWSSAEKDEGVNKCFPPHCRLKKRSLMQIMNCE